MGFREAAGSEDAATWLRWDVAEPLVCSRFLASICHTRGVARHAFWPNTDLRYRNTLNPGCVPRSFRSLAPPKNPLRRHAHHASTLASRLQPDYFHFTHDLRIPRIW